MIGKLRTLSLLPHPDTPPRGINGIDVRWFEKGDGKLILRFQVNGVDALSVPEFAGKGRADNLWQNTCFELFLRDEAGAGYAEFNFSPSERWAAYRFDSYRDGMSEAEIDPVPEVTAAAGAHLFVLTAILPTTVLSGIDGAGLSAVIDENDGTRSFWALAHGEGKPDFHAAACFALPLAAPETT